jgi:uncharacterized protein YceH (UPF0502 family)
LARAAGEREARWMHLLCGPPDAASSVANSDAADFVASTELAALKARQATLEAQVDQLSRLVDKLYSELGIDRP